MATKQRISQPLTGLERQKEFLLNSTKNGNNNDSFFITEKVMESMRDSGYRDVRRAINDLIDNAKEAGAKKVAVVTTSGKGAEKNAREKITNIAVVDDGHGMLPDMLKYAIAWGGTDRHNQRTGLGRFGFGLPTAAISVTRTYEVYSKVKGGKWHKIRVDLDSIAQNAMTSGGKITTTPNYEETTLPDFVKSYIKDTWKEKELEQGTVVLLLNPDRIRSFATPQVFQNKMMLNLGLTYRHFMPDVAFYVNDKKVEMIDPLFLNPNCIGYDVGNGLMAEGLDDMMIPVKNKLSDTEDIVGNIRLRFSVLHPKFQKGDLEKYTNKGLIPNRFNTMKENNGYFIVCRAGRQIDVVRDTNYQSDSDNTTIVNYDANWVIELHFDPVLDELFGITTNKQQVEIDSYLWDIFKENNLPAIVTSLRSKLNKVRTKDEVEEEEKKEEDRDSEQIMRESEKFDKTEVPTEKIEQGEEKLKGDAEKAAKKNNTDVITVTTQFENDAEKKKFKVEFTDLPGAPFYDIELWGTQTRLKINTAHRFYSDIYSQQDGRGKTAVEILLFVLAKCEIESTGDKLLFYGNERFEWSRKLDLRLKMLDSKDPILDKKSFDEENN